MSILPGIVASGFRVGGGGPEPPAGTVEYPGHPGVFATIIESPGPHTFPQIDTTFPQTIGRAPFTSRAAFFAFRVRGPFAVQKVDSTFDAYFYVTDSSGAAIVDGDGGSAGYDRLVCRANVGSGDRIVFLEVTTFTNTAGAYGDPGGFTLTIWGDVIPWEDGPSCDSGYAAVPHLTAPCAMILNSSGTYNEPQIGYDRALDIVLTPIGSALGRSSVYYTFKAQGAFTLAAAGHGFDSYWHLFDDSGAVIKTSDPNSFTHDPGDSLTRTYFAQLSSYYGNIYGPIGTAYDVTLTGTIIPY